MRNDFHEELSAHTESSCLTIKRAQVGDEAFFAKLAQARELEALGIANLLMKPKFPASLDEVELFVAELSNRARR